VDKSDGKNNATILSRNNQEKVQSFSPPLNFRCSLHFYVKDGADVKTLFRDVPTSIAAADNKVS